MPEVYGGLFKSRKRALSVRTGLACSSHSNKKRKVTSLEGAQGKGCNNQATVTNEHGEAGNKELSKMREREQFCAKERYTFVILLAVFGLQN